MEKKTRNPEKTRAHILEVAFKVVMQNGFQGASINAIIEKLEVTKGAFFYYFASKHELGYAITDEILSQLILNMWIHPLSAYKNPVSGIVKILKKKIDTITLQEMALGCPLNNLTQEMSAVDPVFREKLLAVMLLWITELEKHLIRAKQGGYLKKDVNTRELAEFIVTVHEGAIGMAKTAQDKAVLKSLHHSLKKHLDIVSV